jgi:thioredoxin-dependent peroxiredoxin
VLTAVTLVVLLALPGGAAAVQVGDLAPDFKLPATTGGQIRLSDYRGKQMVLLEFYHADWGPTWIANLSARRDDHQQFLDLGIQVLGISTNHAYSQKSFAASLELPYPLLSDYPDGRTILAYEVGYYEGQAKRLYARPSFFLIDKEGIVRGFWGQRPMNPDEIWAPDPLFSSQPILDLARELVQSP